MSMTTLRALALFALLLGASGTAVGQQERTFRIDLIYHAPVTGQPKPNFSPYGTQVELTDLPAGAPLPDRAARPAKVGTVQIGLSQSAWFQILVTSDSAHPQDLCRLYVDRNRNGDFADDGPAITADLIQNKKTLAWASNFNKVELSIPYRDGIVEPYMVNFWTVREGEDAPSVIRYSVASWRSGAVRVDGIEALVAVMDSDNNAIFDVRDRWSILAASEKDAATRVLSIKEARTANRFMFLDNSGGKELVLEFRSMSPDGRSVTFAVVDYPVTKAQDRASDDTLAAERARPRASQPFQWIESDFDRASEQAKESGRKLILDFWTSWCGPCHDMDAWIWTDAEVVTAMNGGYVGVKLDGDLEKDLVRRFRVVGYPTIIVLDSAGQELRRFNYMSSKDMLEALRR